MKNIFLISLFLIINCCNGQEKKDNRNSSITKSIKKDTMKDFILNKYKDWELDNSYTSSTEERRFLKKKNARVEINFLSDGIQVRSRDYNSPYEKVEGYSNSTKSLISEIVNFYATPIGKTLVYNEKGQITKEIDYEKPYKFTIKDLIEKIKKEEHVNLENTSEGGNAGRRSKDGIFYYEVSIDMKAPLITELKYILVDGNTGKTLFTTTYYTKGKAKNPFDEYLETLKK